MDSGRLFDTQLKTTQGLSSASCIRLRGLVHVVLVDMRILDQAGPAQQPTNAPTHPPVSAATPHPSPHPPPPPPPRHAPIHLPTYTPPFNTIGYAV